MYLTTLGLHHLSYQGLSWLPDTLPEHCRLVVSVSPSSEMFDELRRRGWPESNFVEVGVCVRAKRWWKHQRECVKATTATACTMF